jgi:hypothetical protein
MFTTFCFEPLVERMFVSTSSKSPAFSEFFTQFFQFQTTGILQPNSGHEIFFDPVHEEVSDPWL